MPKLPFPGFPWRGAGSTQCQGFHPPPPFPVPDLHPLLGHVQGQCRQPTPWTGKPQKQGPHVDAILCANPRAQQTCKTGGPGLCSEELCHPHGPCVDSGFSLDLHPAQSSALGVTCPHPLSPESSVLLARLPLRP